MTIADHIAGHAALTICESLILTLSERKILSEKDIIGCLMDAAAVHECEPHDEQAETHEAVAALINKMISRRERRRGF